MPISSEDKQRVQKEFATKEGDTGSPQVQVAVLTTQIQAITEHLKLHPKDYAGRRGLLGMVSRRRRLLDYLKGKSPAIYLDMLSRLNIRK